MTSKRVRLPHAVQRQRVSPLGSAVAMSGAYAGGRSARHPRFRRWCLLTSDNVTVTVQATFDELGTPLSEVTFVVVDLETTGGSAQTCAITEIGAVKMRAGEVLGEFQTLVNPATDIPP